MDIRPLMNCLYIKHPLIRILVIEYIESILEFYKIKPKHKVYNSGWYVPLFTLPFQ